MNLVILNSLGTIVYSGELTVAYTFPLSVIPGPSVKCALQWLHLTGCIERNDELTGLTCHAHSGTSLRRSAHLPEWRAQSAYHLPRASRHQEAGGHHSPLQHVSRLLYLLCQECASLTSVWKLNCILPYIGV